MLSWICLLAVLLNFYRHKREIFDLGHQIGGRVL